MKELWGLVTSYFSLRFPPMTYWFQSSKNLDGSENQQVRQNYIVVRQRSRADVAENPTLDIDICQTFAQIKLRLN